MHGRRRGGSPSWRKLSEQSTSTVFAAILLVAPRLVARARPANRGASYLSGGREMKGSGTVELPRRRVGRPADSFTPAQLAALWDVSEAAVLRLLEPGESGMPSFFPHARRQADGTWSIPSADVRIQGRDPERLYTIREFSTLISYGYFTTFRHVSDGKIKHVVVLGQKRIPESEYWRLVTKRNLA
jgi:hypothetical protein